MIGSLRALLDSAIDYAGMFPPVRLPLATAVHNFSHDRRTDHAWMLGHFVLPAQQLAELGTLVDEFYAGAEPFSIALVASAAPDRTAWLAAVREDLASIRQFNAICTSRAAVRALELRLPADLTATFDSELLETLLADLAAPIADAGIDPLTVFIEAPLAGDWRTNIPALVRRLADQRQRLGADIGLKLRTGGLEPTAFPAPEQVAAVIRTCRDAYLPWKATAGLHHALRQYRDEVGTEMHGFLNLLVAAVLAHAEPLGEAEIAAILRDGSIGSFAFEEGQLFWNSRRATLHQIRQARQDGMLSFGSCSFVEPREELEELAAVAAGERS